VNTLCCQDPKRMAFGRKLFDKMVGLSFTGATSHGWRSHSHTPHYILYG
jgi:hypothetical protein